jgi:hypothetical protein
MAAFAYIPTVALLPHIREHLINLHRQLADIKYNGVAVASFLEQQLSIDE